ncbi:hypothetical protein D3C72_1862050 [compost metagenome]
MPLGGGRLCGIPPQRAAAGAGAVLVLRHARASARGLSHVAVRAQRRDVAGRDRAGAGVGRLHRRRHPQRPARHSRHAVRGGARAGRQLPAMYALRDRAAGIAHFDSAAGRPRAAAVQEHQRGHGDRRDGADLPGARDRKRDLPHLRHVWRRHDHVPAGIVPHHADRIAHL